MNGENTGYVFKATVKPSAGIRPAGFIWVIVLLLYAVVGLLFWAVQHFLLHGMSNVISLMILVGLFNSAMIAFGRNEAFVVSRERGVRLGLAEYAPKFAVELPWDQVREVRIRPADKGADVEVIVRRLPEQTSRARRARLAPLAEIALTCLPGIFLLRKPALLTPLSEPLRYRAPLRRVTAANVEAAIRQLAPSSVVVE